MQNYKKYTDIITNCQGIKQVDKHWQDWQNNDKVTKEYYLDGDFTVPENVYIAIIGTATNGTIGLLVELEPQLYKYKSDDEQKLEPWHGTYILKVEGRDKLVRINSSHTKFLNDFTGQTKYVRNVKKHNKKDKKKPINKYFQELHIGDWIFGISPNKSLRIGRVTRYTNHTVWATMGDDLKDKQKEFKMDSISDTYLIDNPEQVKAQLTFSTLKGWNGR